MKRQWKTKEELEEVFPREKVDPPEDIILEIVKLDLDALANAQLDIMFPQWQEHMKEAEEEGSFVRLSDVKVDR